MTDKREALGRLYAGYAAQAVFRQVAAGRPPVLGDGPLDAPLVVVGESPGTAEDQLSELFARAGLPWELCYRTSVLPWRPPGNRVPHNYEIVASYGRLAEEIGIISPLIVVASGAAAWQAVTGGKGGLFTRAAGHWAESGLPYRLLPVWHRMEAETVAALHSALAAAGD